MIESRVSAVITAYNSAAFLADAIRSAVIRSITGEGLYQTAKKALQTRPQAGGPR